MARHSQAQHTLSRNHLTLVFTVYRTGVRSPQLISTIKILLGAFYTPGAGGHKDMAFL